MVYYNYHAQAKNLITAGHCVGAELFDSYHGIAPALVLFFDNHRPMPIRMYRFEEYATILKQKNIQIKTPTNL